MTFFEFALTLLGLSGAVIIAAIVLAAVDDEPDREVTIHKGEMVIGPSDWRRR